MTKARGLLIVGLLLFSGKPAFAELISFETGNLAGWMSAGAVSVVGEVLLPPDFGLWAVAPTEGQYQALLNSAGVAVTELETFFGVSAGFLSGQSYTQGSGLARSFDLGLGDSLSFDWNFVAGDLSPFNDAALFVRDGAGTLLSSVALVGDFGSTGYQPYSFTAAAAGTYLIGLGVFDSADTFNGSYLSVDNFNVVALTPLPLPGPVPVPEPGTLLMLMTGYGAALVARRSRTRSRRDV